MDSIFNSEYYYYLYDNMLRSLIGKCKCKRFDPLNSNATDTLDKVHAYLRSVAFTDKYKEDKVNLNELMDLFRIAVKDFDDRWVEDTNAPLPNIDGYLSLMGLWIK